MSKPTLIVSSIFLLATVLACGAETPSQTRQAVDGTDPSCRPQTCTTLRKNCGVVNDGCGGTVRCGTCAGTSNDCRDNVCERSCSSNNECPGTACINGSCSDKCASAVDCPSGQTCSAGACVLSGAPACSTDSNCRADERCVNGGCVRSDDGNNNGYGRGCNSHSDCSNGDRCSNGVCRRDYNGRSARAECIYREAGFSTPYGSFTFTAEHWLYDSQHPMGIKVDGCTCPNSGGLRVDYGSQTETIGCSRCIKDDAVRTCYE